MAGSRPVHSGGALPAAPTGISLTMLGQDKGETMIRIPAIAAALLLAGPSFAQAPSPSTINVTGHGKLSVLPDTANLHYWLRGEGRTADEATRAMVSAQANIEDGLRGLLGASSRITNSNLVVIEVRDSDCKAEPGRATLSEGPCAIVGYLATSETDVATPNIAKAGTAVGLAGRLGARDARLQGFELRNTLDSQRRAMAMAAADAKAQAQLLATAAGGHLGRALTIQYGSYMAPMSANMPVISQAPPAPPPPPPPPPVEISMKPIPQDVTADVSMSFELLP